MINPALGVLETFTAPFLLTHSMCLAAVHRNCRNSVWTYFPRQWEGCVGSYAAPLPQGHRWTLSGSPYFSVFTTPDKCQTPWHLASSFWCGHSPAGFEYSKRSSDQVCLISKALGCSSDIVHCLWGHSSMAIGRGGHPQWLVYRTND